MFTIPGTENLSPAVKYVIAFAIIFLLLALFALILRRLTGGRLAVTQERGRARQPRLGIVDVYDLDRQRQLILLRRDNVEHLLLVGGPNDVVVETNIVRAAGARLPVAPTAMDTEAAGAGRPAEIPASRPVVEPGLGRLSDRPIAPAAEPGAALEPMLKPTRVTSAPAVTTPVVAGGRPGGGRNGATREPEAAPLPVPDMTRELEATLRQAQPPARPPSVRPEPPKPQAPPPAPAPTPPPTKAEPQAPPRPSRQEPSPTAERPAEPAPVPPAPVPPRPAVAEQRPPAPIPAVPPPSPPPPPPTPRPVATQPSPPPRTDPVPQSPPPPPPPSVEARKEPTPPPSPAEPPPKSEDKPAAKPDPFSLEDIEAEFARLLGRPLDRKE